MQNERILEDALSQNRGAMEAAMNRLVIRRGELKELIVKNEKLAYDLGMLRGEATAGADKTSVIDD